MAPFNCAGRILAWASSYWFMIEKFLEEMEQGWRTHETTGQAPTSNYREFFSVQVVELPIGPMYRNPDTLLAKITEVHWL